MNWHWAFRKVITVYILGTSSMPEYEKEKKHTSFSYSLVTMTRHSLLFTFPWCPVSNRSAQRERERDAPYRRHVKASDRPKPRMWQKLRRVHLPKQAHKAFADKCKLRAGLPPPGQWYEPLPILHNSPWNPHLSVHACTHIHMIGLDLVRYWLMHHGEWLKWAQVLAYCGKNCAWQINKTPGGLDVNVCNYAPYAGHFFIHTYRVEQEQKNSCPVFVLLPLEELACKYTHTHTLYSVTLTLISLVNLII